MGAIYLEHPLHGQKVACGDQEAAHDRANGWVDFDPVARAAEAAVVAPVVASVPSFLAPPESDIPDNFPGRQFLIDAGVVKWADLITKTEAELVAFKGIGPATAREILEKVNS